MMSESVVRQLLPLGLEVVLLVFWVIAGNGDINNHLTKVRMRQDAYL